MNSHTHQHKIASLFQLFLLSTNSLIITFICSLCGIDTTKWPLAAGAQGEMNINHIFHRMNNAIDNFGFEFDSEKTAIRVNFSALCSDINGTLRLTEVAFQAFLHGRGAIPLALMGTTSIIFQSMRYFSQVPFSQQTLPEALTLDELCRAVVWPNHDRSRNFNNGLDERTPADHRRIMFQSLATTEDGRKLPFDMEDWKKQAERRAVELPPSLAPRAEFCTTNCDDDGDEMFHDALDIMQLTKPDIDSPYGNVPRDCFRLLAKQYQGGGFRLHELSIPPGRLHALVKLLPIAQFGHCDHLDIEKFSDLDRVTSCVVKAFHQDLNVDIT